MENDSGDQNMDDYQYQSMEDPDDFVDWENYTPDGDDIRTFLEKYAKSDPNLKFSRLDPGIYRIDDGINATWVKTLVMGSRPSWKRILMHGANFYAYVSRYDNCFTEKSKSLLIATLCFTHPEGCVLLQSTIPRGRWRKHLPETGYKNAGEWYAVAEPSSGNMEPHAEDSVLFLCNHLFGSLQPQGGYEAPRLVVYGKRRDGAPEVANPCRKGGRVGPSCEEVVRDLGVKMLTKATSAKRLDEEDEASQPPPQPPAGAPTSGSSSSTSTHGTGASTGNPTPSHTQSHNTAGGSGSGHTAHNAGGGYGNNTRGHNQRLQPNSSQGSTTLNLANSLSNLHIGDRGRRYHYDGGGHINAYTPRTLPSGLETHQTPSGRPDTRTLVTPPTNPSPRTAVTAPAKAAPVKAAPAKTAPVKAAPAKADLRASVTSPARSAPRAAAAAPGRVDPRPVASGPARGTQQSKPTDVMPRRRHATEIHVAREAAPARIPAAAPALVGGQGPTKQRRGGVSGH
ncbi:hypothetical protein F5144DRAFT_560103 [Chaetomium tenue]|uniref:Uncharacterized protein n=1 Tax=Chaetomium tenue TaxID=1854479 RepID=A0ACB7PIZ3_9PEZI|nr:hypothetical protein F5144DRAFT_560103 [Chaetomium globosum]